jgi:WD40 repeat protein
MEEIANDHQHLFRLFKLGTKLLLETMEFIKIWDLETGDCIRKVKIDGLRCFEALCEEGAMVACGCHNRPIIVNVVNNGTVIYTLKGHSMPVDCLLELPNQMLTSGSDDKSIKLWNLDQRICIKTLRGHNGSVYCLHWLKDGGGTLASGSGDHTIKIWNIESC